MAMVADAMLGGTTPPSPLRPPPPSVPLLRPHSTSPVGGGIRPSTTMEQGGQASADLGQDLVGSEVLRSPSSSKKRMKVAITNSQEISQTAGSKRLVSHASDSLRASKAAKVIDPKVITAQLQKNSKTAKRKNAPIVCRSPGINMMARKRAQSYARSPKSASLHDLSPVVPHATPNSAETPLHDLSPAATHDADHAS